MNICSSSERMNGIYNEGAANKYFRTLSYVILPEGGRSQAKSLGKGGAVLCFEYFKALQVFCFG